MFPQRLFFIALLLLVPFFVPSVHADIWQTLNYKNTKTEQQPECRRKYSSIPCGGYIEEFEDRVTLSWETSPTCTATYTDTHVDSEEKSYDVYRHWDVSCEYYDTRWIPQRKQTYGGEPVEYITFNDVESCPPDGFESYNIIKEVDNSNRCYSLLDILQADSCDFNATDSVIPAISSPASGSGCVLKDDGSQCHYSASSDGSYYQLTDGNCYEGDLPELEPETPPAPDTCTNSTNALGESFLACSANPDNVCSGTGSTIDGQEIMSCESGCGYMPTGEFVCVGPDSDGDGLIDEPDPDIPDEPDPDQTTPDPEDPDLKALGAKLDVINQSIKDGAGDNSALETKLDAINQTLKDGIGGGGGGVGSLGTKLENIKEKLDFTFNSEGTQDFAAIRALFNQQSINEVKTKAQEKKDEIETYLGTVHTEFDAMFKVTAPSGSYTSQTLDLSWGTFDISWVEHIRPYMGWIASVIILLAFLAAAAILLGD